MDKAWRAAHQLLPLIANELGVPGHFAPEPWLSWVYAPGLRLAAPEVDLCPLGNCPFSQATRCLNRTAPFG